jgi:hypothetical protein
MTVGIVKRKGRGNQALCVLLETLIDHEYHDLKAVLAAQSIRQA